MNEIIIPLIPFLLMIAFLLIIAVYTIITKKTVDPKIIEDVLSKINELNLQVEKDNPETKGSVKEQLVCNMIKSKYSGKVIKFIEKQFGSVAGAVKKVFDTRTQINIVKDLLKRGS
jgi:hypothetical protein